MRMQCPGSSRIEAQHVSGFGTSAVHLWVATVCLALPSPATVSLVSQAVHVCFATILEAAPARSSPPLAWRFNSVVSTSAHLEQAIAGDCDGKGG